ncbi:ACP S-malonyltransferase [Pseudonocardiaceae bacterium YIM PH 21723]|nr:ACP S-malonyltransferase [Pseudonocardiaceae bacterium YIM PH 21723]
MIALLTPGQGSQAPGMLSSWLEVAGARERIAAWSDATGLDLLRLGTEADAEEIKDTAVTQPLVVALALLAHAELINRIGALPADTVVAGHSVGELAAAAVAGVLTEDDAVALAAIRGAEMAKACAVTPTGMAAVMGGDPEAVVAALAELDLTPANRNGAGQIVAAGAIPAIEKLVGNAPEGTRVKQLAVAGAFHTHFMAPAQDALRSKAADIAVADPRLTLLSNADGTPVTTGAEVLSRLISQVTSPVRWDSCMTTIGTHSPALVAELPPAGTLTGLVKRELKGTATLAVKTPAELDKLVDQLKENLA